MNKKYYVVYNQETAYWCWEKEAFELLVKGWKIYGIAENEEMADKLSEEACYI